MLCFFTDGLSDEDDDDKSDIEKENNSQQTNAINIEDLPDDIELDLNIAAQPTKKRKKKRKSKQKLLKGVKRKKRIDNRMKVLEQIQRDKALRKLMLANQKVRILYNLLIEYIGNNFKKCKGLPLFLLHFRINFEIDWIIRMSLH